jgi:hypothetical protein
VILHSIIVIGNQLYLIFLRTHDGFQSDDKGYSTPTDANSNYAGQSKLFEDVGGDIMNNAWSGFNTTLLAYGQTGSGTI